MPAVVSHFLMAERVFPQIEKNMPELDRNAFWWGANGPDIFFAHRVIHSKKHQSLSKVSHKMHNNRADVLLNYLSEYAQAYNDPVALSYAMGFVTHYAFDSVAHPYIVDYAETASQGKTYRLPLISNVHDQIRNGIKISSIYHNKLEGCIDTILLMSEKHIPIHKFRIENTCPKDKRVYQAAGEVLSSYITDRGLEPYKVPCEEVMRAQADWRWCLKLLNDKRSIKRGILRNSEKLLRLPPLVSAFFRNVDIEYAEDYLNFAHREWKAPADGSIHNESFFDLVEMAEKRSVNLIEKLLNGHRLTRSDCLESFSGKAFVR